MGVRKAIFQRRGPEGSQRFSWTHSVPAKIEQANALNADTQCMQKWRQHLLVHRCKFRSCMRRYFCRGHLCPAVAFHGHRVALIATPQWANRCFRRGMRHSIVSVKLQIKLSQCAAMVAWEKQIEERSVPEWRVRLS